MSIKLELSEENPIVLKHMGLALQNIAAEQTVTIAGGKPEPVIAEIKNVNINDPEVISLLNSGQGVDVSAGYVVEQQYGALAEDGVGTIAEVVDTPPPPADDATNDTPPPPADDATNDTPPPPADDELANGLPHDERIHSRAKTKNKDGSWKTRKMPNTFQDKDVWRAFITSTETELRMALGTTNDTPSPPADDTTDPVAQAGFGQGTNATPPPPTSDIDVTGKEPRHFPELMRLVTMNGKKGSSSMVHQIIADLGLGSLQELPKGDVKDITKVYYALEAMVK